MIKNKDLLRYAQLQDSSSKKCLGTVSASNSTLGLVDCNDRDPLQFWDLRDVYNNNGILRKSYNVAKSIDIAGFDLTMPELANDQLGNQITIRQNNGVYEYTSQPWGVSPAYGQFAYDNAKKSLKGVYFSNDGDTTVDTCVNTQGSSYGSKVGINGNASFGKTESNTTKTCDTKWNVLVKSCTGALPANGFTCNQETGEYICKPGYYGKNCDFKSSSSTPADAYDNFFNACYEGSAAFENPSVIYATVAQSCARMNTQDYIPADLAGQFYDVVTKTNNKYNDQDFANKAQLLEKDGEYDRDYATKALYVNTEIAKLDDQKLAANTQNDAQLNARKDILLEKQKNNDALKMQISQPIVVNDTLDPVKTVKTNNSLALATLKGSIAAKNGELSATKNKITELTKALTDVTAKINNFIDSCKADGLLCTIKNL